MSQEDFYDHYEITVCLQKTSMTTMRQQFFTRRLLWPLCDNSTSQENFYDQYEKTVSQEDFNDPLWDNSMWDNSMSQEDYETTVFYDHHYETTDFSDHYITTVRKDSMTTMRKEYDHKKISMATMRQQYVSRRPHDHYETTVLHMKTSRPLWI